MSRLEGGQTVDRYVVEAPLGEGGVAVVYRVRHATLGTTHALKVLSAPEADLRGRLVREGQVQARLQHPNIVAVTDVIAVGSSIGLLMEYIRGPSLRQLVHQGPLPVDDALALFRGICFGVAHAHAQGLVHRDLKAANVMLSVGPRWVVPKVADFGLAKPLLGDTSDMRKTRTGASMGTPAFMSPEQITDTSSVDRRTDLWALGCILYELMSGEPPFDRPSIVSLFHQIAMGDYKPIRELRPDVPDRVAQAIDGLLKVEVADRVGDCVALLDFLDGATEALPASGVALQALEAAPTPHEPEGATRIAVTSPTGALADGLIDDTPSGDAPTLNQSPVGSQPTEIEGLDAPVSIRTGERAQATDVGLGGLGLGELLPPPPPPPPEPLRRRLTAIAAVGTVAVLAGLGLGTMVMWASAGPDAAPPDPEPVAVVAPVPEPAPVVARPAPPPVAETEPEPVGAPKPAPAPVVARPRPAPVVAPPEPVVPEPAPVAAPEPPPPGRFAFTGVDKLWLVPENGGPPLTGPSVPPGEYRMWTRFPGAAADVDTGSVTIVSGATVDIRCVPQMAKCVPR